MWGGVSLPIGKQQPPQTQAALPVTRISVSLSYTPVRVVPACSDLYQPLLETFVWCHNQGKVDGMELGESVTHNFPINVYLARFRKKNVVEGEAEKGLSLS